MEIIISNIIVLTIVFLVLGSLKSKVDLKKKEVSEVGKGKSKSDSLDEGRFVIEYGTGLKFIIIICVLICGMFSLITMGVYFFGWNLWKETDLGVVIFFGAFFVFALATFSGIVVWKIKVDGENIYYRNYFGIWKKYSFLELDKIIETKSYKIIVYYKNKRIFSIDNNLPLGIYFMHSAWKYNVKTEQKQ